MDLLAADAAVFETAVSTSPSSLPALAAIFTGLPNLLHGVEAAGEVLEPELETIAEALHARGYATAAFSSDPVLDVESGVLRGFELRMELVTEASELDPPRAVDVVAAFLEWLDAAPRDPFFAFLHFEDALRPSAPPPYDVRFGPANGGGSPTDRDRDLYDGAISSIDAAFGAVRDELDVRGYGESTAWVLTADRGDDRSSRSRGETLSDAALRVPLVVYPPGGLRPGRRVADLVGTIDVAPTLAALADADFRQGAGHPLLPLPRDPEAFAAPPARALLSELRRSSGETLVGIRLADFFVVAEGDGRAVRGYDLARDPDERHALDPSEDPRVASVAVRLWSERETLDSRRRSAERERVAGDVDRP
jgi:arylsulfatase A-like enzyme